VSDREAAPRGEHALRARWQRARAVGWTGLARRVEWRLGHAARAAERARWRARFVDVEPDDATLATAFATTPARLDATLTDLFAPRGRVFWLDADDSALRAAFLARHADAAQRIAAEAAAARRGDLAWVVPGGVADWHAALPGTARWPLDPSDAIAIGAAQPLGDVRLAWEIGRSTHLVRMAQAAWLSQDRALAAETVAGLLDFAAANPPGRGIAWAHAQEAALRAVAWLFCLELVRPFDVLDAAARRRLAWCLLAHAEYVAAHLAEAPTTHNHLVSECFGLVALGAALPRLPGATANGARGARLLWREIAKQVDEEGAHGEGSTHYHGFVLDSALAAMMLADRAGTAVPATVRARIAAMADALAHWMREDGTIPAVGDTDAGRAWRFGGDPLDRRDLIAAAAAAFDRAEWGALAGDAAGAFWITGGRPVPGCEDAPPARASRRYEAGGIGTVRCGVGTAQESLLFRAGRSRFLPDVLVSHLHADALSVVWRAAGEDVLVDPGTYLYSEGEGFRVALRRTASHSCVVVDGRDQADVSSQRFGLTGETPARWLSFEPGARTLCAAAEHPADATPRVRRRLAWMAGRALVLCDDVLGEGAHAIESWLQLPATSGDARGAEALLALPSGRRVRVQAGGAAHALAAVRPSVGDPPGPGWRAPRYGRREPGTALRIDAGRPSLPARLVTVLQLGDSSGAAPPPARIEASGAVARVEAPGFTVRFEGDADVAIEEHA
jgi:hypothetical protein